MKKIKPCDHTKYPRCSGSHGCPHGKEHYPIGDCGKREIKCSPRLNESLVVKTRCGIKE